MARRSYTQGPNEEEIASYLDAGRISRQSARLAMSPNPARRQRGIQQMVGEGRAARAVDDKQAEIDRQAAIQQRQVIAQQRQQEAMQREQAQQAEADRARQVRVAASQGAKTTTDIDTGKRSIATRQDGSTIFKAGPQGGPVPVAQVTTDAAQQKQMTDLNPMLGGDGGAASATGTTTQTVFGQPVRDDRGNQFNVTPETRTDPKTGRMVHSATDPTSGQTVKQTLGFDWAVKDQADRTAAHEQDLYALQLRENAAKQAHLGFSTKWTDANDAFQKAQRDKERLDAKGIVKAPDGRWSRIDEKLSTPEKPYYVPLSPYEAAKHTQEAVNTDISYRNAKKRYDQLLPVHENFIRNFSEIDAEKLRLAEEAVRIRGGLPANAGVAVDALAKGAGLVGATEADAAAQQAQDAAKPLQDGTDSKVLDQQQSTQQDIANGAKPPQGGDNLTPTSPKVSNDTLPGASADPKLPYSSPFPESPKPLPDTPEIDKAMPQIKAIPNVALQPYGTFTQITQKGEWIGSLENGDGSPFITLRPEADRTGANQAILAAGNAGKIPIYLADNQQQRPDPKKEAQWVASVFQAAQDPTMRTADGTKLATDEALAAQGADFPSVLKRLNEGTLSIQNAETIAREIYGTSVIAPDPTDPNTFKQWAKAKSKEMGDAPDTPEKRMAAAEGNPAEQMKVRNEFITDWYQQNQGKPGVSLDAVQKMQADQTLAPKPFFGLDDTLVGASDFLSGLIVGTPAAFFQLTEGLKRPDLYSPAAKKAFLWQDRIGSQMEKKAARRRSEGKATSIGDTLRETGQSAAFSLATLGASIPAGLAGGWAGAQIGAAVGLPEGGVGAVPGAITGATVGTVTGLVSSMAASGASGYRMAGAQFLDQQWKAAQEAVKQRTGRYMTPEEEEKAYQILLPMAQHTGLWEAGPEAVGNAFTLGAGKIVFGVGKKLSTQLAGTLAGKVAAKMEGSALGKLAALVADQVVEISTETITNIEQSADQKKAEAFAAGKPYDKIAADWSAKSVVTNAKDVAPQTLMLGALMLGGGAAVKATVNKLAPVVTDEEKVKRFTAGYNAALAGTDGFQPLADVDAAKFLQYVSAGAFQARVDGLKQAAAVLADPNADENQKAEADNAMDLHRAAIQAQTDAAANAAAEIAGIKDAKERDRVSGAVKVATGNINSLTPAEMQAVQGIKTKDGQPYFVRVDPTNRNSPEVLSTAARLELMDQYPDTGVLVANRESWTAFFDSQTNATNEQDPQGQDGQSPAETNPPPGNQTAPLPGAGGAGQAAGAGGTAANPAPGFSPVARMAMMEPAIYDAQRKSDPNTPKPAAIVAQAYSEGAPVHPGMARAAGIKPPEGYTLTRTPDGPMLVQTIQPEAPKAASDRAAAIAQRVKAKIEAQRPNLKGMIRVVENSTRENGGAFADHNGISISLRDVEREAGQYQNESDYEKVLETFIVGHEAVHIAQWQAVSDIWKANGGKLDGKKVSFDEFWKAWYARIAEEMGGNDGELFQRAAEIYGPMWESLSEFNRTAEAIQMIVEGIMNPETIGEMSNVLQKIKLDQSPTLLETLKRAVKYIIEAVKSGSMKLTESHLRDIEKLYRELVASETPSSAPGETGGTNQKEKPTTTNENGSQTNAEGQGMQGREVRTQEGEVLTPEQPTGAAGEQNTPPAAEGFPPMALIKVVGTAETEAAERLKLTPEQRDALRWVNDGLYQILAAMPEDQRKPWLDAQIDQWHAELEEKAEAEKQAARKEKAAGKPVTATLAERRASAITMGTEFDTISKILELGTIRRKPNAIALIKARKDAGAKLTEKEMELLRSVNEWDDMPKITDYPNSGWGRVARLVLARVMPPGDRGQNPDTMASAINPDWKASDLAAALWKELKQISQNTRDDSRDPNRDMTDAEAEAEIRRMNPIMTMLDMIVERHAEDAPALVDKAQVFADLSDRFNDEQRKIVAKALMAESQRVSELITPADFRVGALTSYPQDVRNLHALLVRLNPEQLREMFGSIELGSPASPVTPAMDAAYLSAVERGDMETAQRMVDDAAKAAGYTIGKAFHGTKAKFDTFRVIDLGFHFGLSEDQVLGETGRFSNTPRDHVRIIEAYLDIKNPLELSDHGSWDGWLTIREVNEKLGTTLSEEGTKASEIRKAIQQAGYDGISYENLHEGEDGSRAVIAFEPNQIKSADPVTRDARGNVIPLSKRFNPTSDSILYSPATQPDLFAAIGAPENREELSKVRVGTMSALGAYKTLTAKREAGKKLTADEEEKLLQAEQALGQKMAFDMGTVKSEAPPFTASAAARALAMMNRRGFSREDEPIRRQLVARLKKAGADDDMIYRITVGEFLDKTGLKPSLQEQRQAEFDAQNAAIRRNTVQQSLELGPQTDSRGQMSLFSPSTPGDFKEARRIITSELTKPANQHQYEPATEPQPSQVIDFIRILKDRGHDLEIRNPRDILPGIRGIEQATGATIRFFESATLKSGGITIPRIPSVVLINSNSKVPVGASIAHELTHLNQFNTRQNEAAGIIEEYLDGDELNLVADFLTGVRNYTTGSLFLEIPAFFVSDAVSGNDIIALGKYRRGEELRAKLIDAFDNFERIGEGSQLFSPSTPNPSAFGDLFEKAEAMKTPEQKRRDKLEELYLAQEPGSKAAENLRKTFSRMDGVPYVQYDRRNQANFDFGTDAGFGTKDQGGFDFGKPTAERTQTATEPAQPVGKQAEKSDTEADRNAPTVARFRPKSLVEFKNPITGPSGAKLVAYEWKYKLEEGVDKRGEDTATRVSNWEESQTNDATGREVVHQFYVDTPDGKSQLVSLESALKILGYTAKDTAGTNRVKALVSVVKTRARNQMEADRLQAEIDRIESALREVRALPLPEIVKTDGPEILSGMKKVRVPVYTMGDAKTFPDWKFEGPKTGLLAESWRENRMRERGLPTHSRRETAELAAIQSRIKKADEKIAEITSKAPPAVRQSLPTAPEPGSPEFKTLPTEAKREIVKAKIAEKAAEKQGIQDFGEKIGGARKDTATKTGPTGTAKPSNDKPGWFNRYEVSEVVAETKPESPLESYWKRSASAGENTESVGRFVINDKRKLDWTGKPERATRQTFATREEAEAHIPIIEVSRNHRVRSEKVEGTGASQEESRAYNQALTDDANHPGRISFGVIQTAKNRLRIGTITQEQYDKIVTENEPFLQGYQPIAIEKPKPADYRYSIWRDVTDRKRVQVVKQTFDTEKEALEYMTKHAAEIIETKTSWREELIQKPEKSVRKGPERRNGPATAEMFQKSFGFRGVEFGNWMRQAGDGKERQEVLNHAYDGLHDLAEVLGVPPMAMSLNGELGLAFGARGQGLSGAKAHYEPDYVVINLTKMSGAGSLAHEWIHALDHYLGRQDGMAKGEWKTNKAGDRVLEAGSPENTMVSHGFSRISSVREVVRNAFNKLKDTIFNKAVEYVEDSNNAEKFVASSRKELEQRIANLRKEITAGPSEYWKRRKAATEAQLAVFDSIADRFVAGQDLETDFRKITESKSRFGTWRHTSDSLEKIGEIYKATIGRSGFQKEGAGPLDYLRSDVIHYEQRLKMLASAAASETKVRKVPTDFSMNAKRIDQGSASDYWNTPHEMLARAFSAYVEDRIAQAGGTSDFLSYGSDNNMWFYRQAGVKPFPEGSEREMIDKAFDDLFSTLETKETDKGVALYSPATPGPFYSKLEREVAAKVPNNATPQQIIATITAAGVKPEEIKWSGIVQKLQELGPKVDKAKLLGYLRDEASVRFEEVDSRGKEFSESETSRMREDQARLEYGYPYSKLTDDQKRTIDNLVRESQSNDTKYSQYQLPGGENYREVVLAMPIKASIDSIIVEQRDDELNGNPWVAWEKRRDGTKGAQLAIGFDRDSVTREALAESAGRTSPDYTSTHFPDIPNYVAHMRLNERGDGLFIEEIQSDRHQAGRKGGYSRPQYKAIGKTKNREAHSNLYNTKEEAIEEIKNKPGYEDAVITTREMDSVGTPDAPHRTDWPLAMFKRALRDAVASGKKWIGWTVGETQNERYDLSKQVDAIQYQKMKNGSFSVSAIPKNGGLGISMGTSIPASELESHVGKEIASKIINDDGRDNPESFGPRRILDGVDLKVGGSGMKGFYDTMLPKEIGKYVKQWGGVVEKGVVSNLTGPSSPMSFSEWKEKTVPDGTPDQVAKLYDRYVSSFPTTPIWRVNITPAMEKSVPQGQPLFAPATNAPKPERNPDGSRKDGVPTSETGGAATGNLTPPEYSGKPIIENPKPFRVFRSTTNVQGQENGRFFTTDRYFAEGFSKQDGNPDRRVDEFILDPIRILDLRQLAGTPVGDSSWTEENTNKAIGDLKSRLEEANIPTDEKQDWDGWFKKGNLSEIIESELFAQQDPDRKFELFDRMPPSFWMDHGFDAAVFDRDGDNRGDTWYCADPSRINRFNQSTPATSGELYSPASRPDPAILDRSFAMMPAPVREVFKAVAEGLAAGEDAATIKQRLGLNDKQMTNITNWISARMEGIGRAASPGGLKPKMVGDKIVGDYKRAGSAGPLAAVHQIRAGNGLPERISFKEVRERAAQEVAKDFDGTLDRLAAMRERGETMGLDDSAQAMEILYRAQFDGRNNDPTTAAKLAWLGLDYLDTGSETARSLAIRRDPDLSPAERFVRMVAEVRMGDDKLRKRLKGKTRQEQADIMAGWLKNMEKVKANLLKRGMDLDATLARWHAAEEARRKAAEENPRTHLIIETVISKLSALEKAVVRMMRDGSKLSTIAAATGLKNDEVLRIHREFFKSAHEAMTAAAKKYTETVLSSPASNMMDDILASLGFLSEEDFNDTAPGYVAPELRPKPTEPKRKPAPAPKPSVPDLTPEQQAALDAAWEKFKDSDPADWTTLYPTEMKNLEPMVGQVAFEEWKGQAKANWKARQEELFSQPVNETTGEWSEDRPYTGQGELIRPQVNETKGLFDLNDPRNQKEIKDQIAKTYKTTFMDKVMEAWQMAILTGLQTQIVNTTSNLINAGFHLGPRRAVEAIVNTVLQLAGAGSTERASLGEFIPMSKNFWTGVRNGAANAVMSWKLEQRGIFEDLTENAYLQLEFDGSVSKPGKKSKASGVGGESRQPANKGPIAKVMRSISFRAMTAADEFMKGLVGQIEQAAQAHRIAAVQEKLRGDAYKSRMEELMKPGSAAAFRAIEETHIVTFQEQLKGDDPQAIRRIDQLAQAIQHGKRMPWLGRVLTAFVPFVQTPTNIFKQAVELSPLGGFLAVVDAARALRARYMQGGITEGEAKKQAAELYNRARLVKDVTNQLIGMAIIYTLLGMTGEDDDDPEKLPWITGTAPYKSTKRGERDNKFRVMPPMTIRTPWGQMSYARFDPFATLATSLVDGINLSKEKGGLNAEWMGAWISRFKDQADDKTFLQGISNLAHAAEDPERFLSRAATGFVTGFVPNLWRQAAREADPYMRDTTPPAADPFIQKLFKSVGYAVSPKSAPLKIDIWGNPIPSRRGEPLAGSEGADFLFRMIDPTNAAFQPKADPIDLYIFRWNLRTADPDQKIAIEPIDDTIQIRFPGETKAQMVPLTTEERLAANISVGRTARELLGGGWDKKPLNEETARRITETFATLQRAERNRIREAKITEKMR